MVNYK